MSNNIFYKALAAVSTVLMNLPKRSLIKATIWLATFPTIFFTVKNGPLYAEESKGFYAPSSFGSSLINKGTWEARISNLDYKGDLTFDDGTSWGTGIGYDFGNRRIEIFYSQSSNNIKGITAEMIEDTLNPITADASASGKLNINNFMINTYFDFPIGEKFETYLGGGVGGSKINIDRITVASKEISANNTSKFSYQGTLGLSYTISKNLKIFGQGTYSGISNTSQAINKYGIACDNSINYSSGFSLRF